MNCVEFLDVLFACAKLGAILQPLNWRLSPAELGALLADAEPSVLVFGPEFRAQVDTVRARASFVKHWLCLAEPGPGHVLVRVAEDGYSGIGEGWLEEVDVIEARARFLAHGAGAQAWRHVGDGYTLLPPYEPSTDVH